jgi:hypothetical protein
MPRPRTPEKQRELDELVRVLRVLAGFKRSVIGEKIGDMFVQGVEDAYRRGSLSQLRMGYNDLVESAQAYSAQQLRQLDMLLREQAGTSLEALFEKRNARILKIRERGRIGSDEQYYLIREYFEFIWDDASRAEEAQALQDLMSGYEDRKGRAAAKN